jgi:hypothetical protein
LQESGESGSIGQFDQGTIEDFALHHKLDILLGDFFIKCARQQLPELGAGLLDIAQLIAGLTGNFPVGSIIPGRTEDGFLEMIQPTVVEGCLNNC